MSVAFAVEPYDEVIGELRGLFGHEWAAVGVMREDMPLDPDYEFYRGAQACERLKIYTVRRDGALIGYGVFFLAPNHPHYRTTRWAANDTFWIEPEHRNIGLLCVGWALMRFIHRDLRKDGPVVVYMETVEGHPELAVLLHRLGYVILSTGLILRLA